MKQRIVLAYAGGVETSGAIQWLVEERNAEVIAVTLDLGQGRELEGVRDRALDAGAVRAHVLDVREEFARDYVLPALQAGALYEGRAPMATALGRPLIARQLVEIARIERADAIAHGWAGSDDDRIRIDAAARALNPDVLIVTPARATAAGARRVNIDTNLWGRSITGGALEDSWAEPPPGIYAMTKAAADAPNAPAYVEVAFVRGVPRAINGVPMSLTELIESLSVIAGQHGVGRLDVVEHRLGGTVSREIREAPAAIVLHAAHQALEALVSPKELVRLKAGLSVTYADLVHQGLWFTPMREALDAFNARVQQQVTGVVRMKLFKGQHTIVGRSPQQADCSQDRPATRGNESVLAGESALADLVVTFEPVNEA